MSLLYWIGLHEEALTLEPTLISIIHLTYPLGLKLESHYLPYYHACTLIFVFSAGCGSHHG